MSFIKFYVLAISLLILNGCSDNKSDFPLESKYTSLQISPTVSSVPVGLEQPFAAIAYRSDGSSIDVTNLIDVNWSSTDESVALIGSRGKAGIATGLSPGNTTITATYSVDGRHLTATAQLTVNNLSVTSFSVTPSTTSVPSGLEQQFVATVFLSDGSSRDVTEFSGLSWTSSDVDIASFKYYKGKAGRAVSLRPGNVTIDVSGEINNVLFSDKAELIVTGDTVDAIRLTPALATVPVGLDIPFSVIGLLSNGGVVDLTEFSGLTWSSSNKTIAEVTGSRGMAGRVTGLQQGQTVIAVTAQLNGSQLSASTPLTVTNQAVDIITISPSTTSIPVGVETRFTVSATLSDGSAWDITTMPGLKWESSEPEVAIIGSKGMGSTVTGLTVGESTITVSGTIGGKSLRTDAKLLVNNAVLMSLSIAPRVVDVPKGFEQSFTAMGTFSDGSHQDLTLFSGLKWTSSDPMIASLGSRAKSGTATGLAVGTVIISASANIRDMTLNDNVELNITDAKLISLALSPSQAEVAKGLSQAFTAIASFSDNTTLDVTHFPAITWSSSNVAVSIMGEKAKAGRAHAIGAGNSVITANYITNEGPLSSSAQLGVVSLFDGGCVLGSLTLGDKTYTCPLLASIAVSNNIEQMAPVIENGRAFSRMNHAQSITYCNKLGQDSRLPTKDELLTLFNAFGNVGNYGWPINSSYRSSTFGQQIGYHLNILLSSGDISELHDDNPNYVSCVSQ